MPLYNSATTASALGLSPKWLDNLLSHNDIAGVQAETQGVSRRLSLSAVLTIALAKELIDNLNVSSAAGLGLAHELLQLPDSTLAIGPHLQLRLSLTSLRASVLEQLSHAVETAPTPRRGRPPKR